MFNKDKAYNEESYNNERYLKIDGWSVLEAVDKKINKRFDLNVEHPSKKKRSGEEKKYHSIFDSSQDGVDFSDVDEKSDSVDEVEDIEVSETIEEEGEECERSDSITTESDKRESESSTMMGTKNSNLKNYEEGYESDEKKMKSKKMTKASKKKNRAKKFEEVEKEEENPETEDLQLDGVDYEVEKIIDMRQLKRGKREFLIRWKGFSANDDTWEPEANLDCKDLMEEYFQTKESRNERQSDEEDEMKLSVLKKKDPEIRGRKRRRKRGSRNNDEESENNNIQEKRLYESVSRSSSPVSKGNTSAVISEDDEDEPKNMTKKMKGRNKSKRKRKTDSTRKSKRNKMENHKDSDSDNSAEKSIESNDSGMEDAVEYEVERILDVREMEDGSQEFFIKWKGFASKYNSWEPENHLNCNGKLKRFLREKDSNVSPRELRFERKTTNRLILESPPKRKLSSRIRKLPPKCYDEQ